MSLDSASRGRGGLLQPLREITDRERVAVLDRTVAGVEKLEEDVRDPDLLEFSPEGLGAEVEKELVLLPGVDVDRAQAAESIRMAARHAHGIPREPALPHVVPQ